MQNDVAGTPPPPPHAVQAEQTADGNIQNGAAGSLTEAVLSLLGSVLALL